MELFKVAPRWLFLKTVTDEGILALAKENNCKTVAFPCISTGVYHFPKEQAALIALETVLSNLTAPIEKVIFCCFSDSDAEIYRAICKKMNVNP